MLASSVGFFDLALSALSRDVADLRAASATASGAARAEAIGELLRAADELTATAVSLVGRGDLEAATGLPTEMVLLLEARRTGAEARMIAQAAATLRTMPRLARQFADGVVSWGQVRAIVSAVTRVSARDRDSIDAFVGDNASAMASQDPDALIRLVDEEVSRCRADLTLSREDRAVENGFLAVQGRLDGGATFYGEADAESAAAIVDALDAAAPPPVRADGREPTRAQQRMDALVGICEASLAGGGAPTRPRPRVLAVLDVADMTADARATSMNLLWSLAGRTARLTSVAAEALLCDPTIVPVLFDRGHPFAVGDASTPVSGKVRTALVARDGGCRFPGCGAPASWCDAHHIVPGRGNQTGDLVLLCRRCHRRVHRHRWRIRLRDDAAIDFTRRGRTYTSRPRHRSPPLE